MSDLGKYCCFLATALKSKQCSLICQTSDTPFSLQGSPFSLQAVSGQRAWWPRFLLALPAWHNFLRKSYFFFYKLIKQVTNNVFKKRKAKRSCGRGFWGVCTPPVEFNKWRPKRNERNSSQDSKRDSRKMKARFQNWRNLWIQSWRY